MLTWRGKSWGKPLLAANALLLCAHAALSVTSSYAGVPPLTQTSAKAPALQIDPLRGTASVDVSVMTYNVAGLPWPLKKGREEALKDIADEIETLREGGRAPDIIVLQEAFTPAAARIGAFYPNRLSGPAASDRSVSGAHPINEDFIHARRFDKGEGLGKVMSSGLLVLSEYPIIASTMTPFQSASCAGYDCLANKGAVIAAIQIPGAPSPLQIMTTHMNSRDSAGVPYERSLAAHHQQGDEIGDLMARGREPGWPFIYAGDFNSRHASDRFDYNARILPGVLVRQYCAGAAQDCEMHATSEDAAAAPWLETQDLQGFVSGARVDVRPIRAEKMFDEPVKGRVLSDHDAYVVTYRLTWKVQNIAAAS